MMNKIHVSLLILCTILPQGIWSLLKNNVEESSNLLVRRKRIIDQTPNGNRPVSIDQIPYIVNVIRDDCIFCGASILLPDLILTAAHCVEEDDGWHQIKSGSSHVNEGRNHNIYAVLVHPKRQLYGHTYDLAMVEISPPIDFENSPNRMIPLYHGQIPPNTLVTVSGWGCNSVKYGLGCMCRFTRKLKYPDELRSISVPTISQQDCRRAYKFFIAEHSDRNICTYDRVEGKYCSEADSGGPLVINNQLAGVYSWSGDCGGPDVFMNLSHPEHRDWILEKMELYLRNSPRPSAPSSQTLYSSDIGVS